MGKRILIISIKAGAGHLRAAQALEEVYAEKHSEAEVKHIEALEFTNSAFQKSFTATYEKLAKDMPNVWGYLYDKMEKKSVKSKFKKMAAMVDSMNSKPLWKEVKAYDPDAVICTHYFPSEMLSSKRLKGKLDCPIFTTLTDYDIHTMWLQEGVDHYFVATEEMAFAMEEKGLSGAGVTVSGIPILPIFSKKYPAKSAMRKQLGLQEKATTVLLSAGGFGLAGIDETVAILSDNHPDVQFVAISGKNAELQQSLEKVAASRGGRVVPYGFVTNMHELMAASDLFVGKCGGLTTSECLAMGLPMIVFNPIPGQEERNADFLLESGVALRANTNSHLKFKVGKVLNDNALLTRMKNATKSVAKPDAAYTVAQTVLNKAR